MTNHSPSLIARVDGDEVMASDLIRHLRVTLKWKLVEEAIHDLVIRRACAEANVTVSAEEINEYMDDYRRQRRLFTHKATQGWLDENRLADDDFLFLLEREIRLRKFKDLIAANKIEQRFAYEKQQLDRVELYRIVVEDESAAREIVALLKEKASF